MEVAGREFKKELIFQIRKKKLLYTSQGKNKSSFLQLCNTACCQQIISEQFLCDYSTQLLPNKASTKLQSLIQNLDSHSNICGCSTIISRTSEIFTFICKCKKPRLTLFNSKKTNGFYSEHLIIRYPSQLDYDTTIINPHLKFNPAGDITKFCSYFTTIQSPPFLILSLISIHQLLFQIPGRLLPVLLAIFPTNGKTLHVLYEQHFYQALHISNSLTFY